MSKGSKPRPIQDKDQFDKNWERIFGNNKNKQPPKGKKSD